MKDKIEVNKEESFAMWWVALELKTQVDREILEEEVGGKPKEEETERVLGVVAESSFCMAWTCSAREVNEGP
mgnify:CR=1 FL=1